MINFPKKIAAAITVLCAFASCCALAAESYVRPCGEAVGIKLYTDGLLVVGISDNSQGLRAGDIILSANGKTLERAEDLSDVTEATGDAVSLDVKRKDKTMNITVNPVPTEEGPRLGVWVRDSTAGIGTVTYISRDGRSYAALGHGITDVDTGNILSLKSGNILNCSCFSVTKSKKGSVGELSCTFDGSDIGNILMNVPNGIYGMTETGAIAAYSEMRVASIDEIQEGEASILCDVDGEGVCEYGVEIKKVSKMNTSDKTLVIEVTDSELIEKTGGIVQGMSGSPIIQNGLFVGAVTHVFINNPLRGFGVAGESMAENTASLASQL